MKNLPTPSEMIGMYISRCLYTDAFPVGKVIGTSGKCSVVVRKVVAEDVTPKGTLKFHVGGFSAICENQRDQKWAFRETDETFTMRVSKSSFRFLHVGDKPLRFHDYNF
jgi:hypothetical protein